MAGEGIKTVPVTIPWRDVIHLDIKDPVLRGHVEGFLNHFEKSEYPYSQMDPNTGKISEKGLTGQYFLQLLKQTQNIYKQLGGANLTAVMKQSMARVGMDFVEGKFTISDHNRPAAGNLFLNGSITMFADQNARIPVGIQIGNEYLKGATYKGVDGRQHPVTVDGVMVHEIAHLALKTRDERQPLEVEGIVTTPMGAEQRDPNTSGVGFRKDGNGGYQTLYDKIPEKRGGLELKSNQTDFAANTTTPQDIQRYQMASAVKKTPSVG